MRGQEGRDSVCVCVCVRERERASERETERDTHTSKYTKKEQTFRFSASAGSPPPAALKGISPASIFLRRSFSSLSSVEVERATHTGE